ncbi:MAG TPA: hypothetical protein VIF15_03535, partial [Polyangiaceae bacterium]
MRAKKARERREMRPGGRDRDRVRALSPRMRYACEVDTPPVRPEYEALARDFRALAAQFDLGV